MGEIQVLIALLAFAALILLLVLAVCRFIGLWTWATTWIFSSREEKIGLTRITGHYNANGYLIHSDSDIHLDASGTFKRFELVDYDFRVPVTTTSLIEQSPANGGAGGYINPLSKLQVIPPQPLRPAPVPIPPPPPLPDRAVPHSISTELFKIHTPTDTQIVEEPAIDFTTELIPEPVAEPITEPITKPVATEPTITSTHLHQQISRSSLVLPESVDVQQQQTCKQSQSAYVIDDTLPVITAAVEEEAVITETPVILKRAMSCDSVCSDTSVVLGDLEDTNVTGYLCIGFEYDSENYYLIANILEAKDLISPNRNLAMDTYVKVHLLPDKAANIQTKVYTNTNCPSYKERFVFEMMPTETSRRTMLFHVYSVDCDSHILIGEAEFRMSDVTLKQPITTWLTLTDTGQRRTEFGELLFSISYLPTAERLTIVIVKARNIKFCDGKESGDSFVKVYLLSNGKKVHKKKTSVKKGEKSPIFNEAMIFSVPLHTLQSIQVRLTVAENTIIESSGHKFSIGHIIIGAQASGRALSHWNQMLSAIRKPVAMWHPLRK